MLCLGLILLLLALDLVGSVASQAADGTLDSTSGRVDVRLKGRGSLGSFVRHVCCVVVCVIALVSGFVCIVDVVSAVFVYRKAWLQDVVMMEEGSLANDEKHKRGIYRISIAQEQTRSA